MSFPQINLRSYKTELHSHSHDHAQLVLPIKGVLEMEIGTQTGLINTETAAFITPGEYHSFAGSEDNLFVVIDLEQKNSLPQSSSPFLNVTPITKRFLQFAHYCLINEATDLHTHTLMHDLLLHFISPAPHSNKDTLVLQAKKWIDTHFSQPVDITTLASQCHMSSSQLQRRFKKTTGYSLGAYWRHKRLLHAQFLLSNSHLSIEAISTAVGYEHLSAFSRIFHKSLGIYPSQWREMNLAAKTLP